MTGAHEKFGLTIDELVAACGLGRTSIYGQIRDGRLVARKCGRRTIILPSDAQNWLENLPRLGGGAENSEP